MWFNPYLKIKHLYKQEQLVRRIWYDCCCIFKYKLGVTEQEFAGGKTCQFPGAHLGPTPSRLSLSATHGLKPITHFPRVQYCALWYRHKGIAYPSICFRKFFFPLKSETSLIKTPGSFQNIFPLNFNFFSSRMYIQAKARIRAKRVENQTTSCWLYLFFHGPLFFPYFPNSTVLLHFSPARNRKSFWLSICHELIGRPHTFSTFHNFSPPLGPLLTFRHFILHTSKQLNAVLNSAVPWYRFQAPIFDLIKFVYLKQAHT
jgi:hypothetical protein